MNAPFDSYVLLEGDKAEDVLGKIAAELKTGAVIPYIGPGLTQLSPTEVPMTPETLAAFFGTKVALPKRAKGNCWASAQHIENMKHRSTVSALMSQAFTDSIAPTPLHAYLASLQLPMIVDSWYDATMRSALEGRSGWGEIQGITRAGIGEDRWYRFYEADGTETTKEKAEAWKTVLYKPHGSIAPAKNFLISDADYVEVLTEIDIQTPLPEAVKNRRSERSFLFLGCRFHDQLLRTYARQIMKRSTTTHHAIVDPAALTKNELKFLTIQGIIPIALPIDRACEILIR
ncbi:SIR2 family NAD-dependent protein deacylase [Methylocystis sp.]|uniref:SIR2 family NAD-dependent protein deacylase n=1 Tax=Methylocystis sp. TaxID=1911079 RepID=UPI003DA3DD2C